MSRPDPVAWSSGEEAEIPHEGVSPGNPPSGSSSLDSGDEVAAIGEDPHWSTNPESSSLQVKNNIVSFLLCDKINWHIVKIDY